MKIFRLSKKIQIAYPALTAPAIFILIHSEGKNLFDISDFDFKDPKMSIFMLIFFGCLQIVQSYKFKIEVYNSYFCIKTLFSEKRYEINSIKDITSQSIFIYYHLILISKEGKKISIPPLDKPIEFVDELTSMKEQFRH